MKDRKSTKLLSTYKSVTFFAVFSQYLTNAFYSYVSSNFPLKVCLGTFGVDLSYEAMLVEDILKKTRVQTTVFIPPQLYVCRIRVLLACSPSAPLASN